MIDDRSSASAHPLTAAGLLIRDVESADIAPLLALNEAAVPHVNSIPIEQMHWFREHAAYFRLAMLEKDRAGFLIGLTAEATYVSMNFRWFCARYPSFMYIDRIVIAPSARRCGVGRALYGDLEARARGTAPLLTCEVNTRPRNEVSLAFHAALGFDTVGSQNTEKGTKTVALMAKAMT